MISTLNETDMVDAARHLGRSARGRSAMQSLVNWLDEDGLALDTRNQDAVLMLLAGAWGSFPGTARDAMREALDRPPI